MRVNAALCVSLASIRWYVLSHVHRKMSFSLARSLPARCRFRFGVYLRSFSRLCRLHAILLSFDTSSVIGCCCMQHLLWWFIRTQYVQENWHFYVTYGAPHTCADDHPCSHDDSSRGTKFPVFLKMFYSRLKRATVVREARDRVKTVVYKLSIFKALLKKQPLAQRSWVKQVRLQQPAELQENQLRNKYMDR